MQDLLDILRVQRHDFMNHLQVISGLLQLKYPERALDYIYEVAEELKKASVISKISSAEIAMAILRADLNAHKLGVCLNCNVSSKLDRGHQHSSALAELIGELLEIAVQEVAESAGDPWAIDLDIYDKDGEYVFQIGLPCRNSLDSLSFTSRFVFIEEATAKINGRVKFANSTEGAVIIIYVPAGRTEGEPENQRQLILK